MVGGHSVLLMYGGAQCGRPRVVPDVSRHIVSTEKAETRRWAPGRHGGAKVGGARRSALSDNLLLVPFVREEGFESIGWPAPAPT